MERGNCWSSLVPHGFGLEYKTRLHWEAYRAPLPLQRVAGFLAIDGHIDPVAFAIAVPLISLMTAILPLALGNFTGFRFRLWHYLAYTALVAVELAYYLRWQE
jgi:hypothetical protein